MKKVTEQNIKNLKDALQNIIITIFENADANCKTVEDYENFKYKVSEDDIRYVLESLDVEMIEVIKVEEEFLDYYDFSNILG